LTDALHQPSNGELAYANPVVGEKKRGAARWWKTSEQRILEEHFPKGGIAACLPLLPGRSASAIYTRASTYGIKLKARKAVDFRRQKWAPNDIVDEMIRRAWPQATSKGAIMALATKVGRPRWWVSKRAVALGLTHPRFKTPDWTEAEDELIQEIAFKGLRAIQLNLKRRGFSRSEAAIKVRLIRLGASASTKADPNHYTATGLAQLLGVDPKTPVAWIRRGLLKAKRHGTTRTDAQGGDEWWIARRDVRQFVIENAAVIDLRKVEKFWFIDLLADGAA
jgi:hypothetical protein